MKKNTSQKTKKNKATYTLKNLLTLGGCFGLGNLSDNFYKQCAVLLAASSTMPHFQSAATVLYSLPFIFFSAWAGWLADVFPKKYIVIVAKTIELLAFLFGAFMLVQQIWWGILLTLFILGSQASFFSPALNGSIPETFPTHFIPRANSLIKLSSTITLLAGTALAGSFLDLREEQNALAAHFSSFISVLHVQTGPEYGRMMASVFTVIIALLGFILSFFLKKFIPKQASHASLSIPFPKMGPINSIRDFYRLLKEKELSTVLLAEAYFYGISILTVISVNNLAIDLNYTNTKASLFTAMVMVGIAVGAILAGSFSLRHWEKIVFPSGIGMSILLATVSLCPLMPKNSLFWSYSLQTWWFSSSLFLCGVFFGAYLIPLTSLIQVIPPEHDKGRILGISNFMSFIAIALFGILFYPISKLPPALTFLVY